MIEEIQTKNKILNDRILALEQEIEIHKQVEINLAEKNKKLNEEKIKENNSPGKTGVEYATNESSIENNISNLNMTNNIIYKNSLPNFNFLNPIKLKKTVRDLEKKLKLKQSEFIELKENYEFIENKLKYYEKKYNGLFNFFEESLNFFYDDEDLQKNKDIYVNIDSIKKGDFSSLNKDEQYSTLIILMKYLLPLINSPRLNNEVNNHKMNINNVNLKFHSIKKDKIKKSNKIEICKKLLFNRIKKNKNLSKQNSTAIASSYHNSSSEYLPFLSVK